MRRLARIGAALGFLALATAVGVGQAYAAAPLVPLADAPAVSAAPATAPASEPAAEDATPGLRATAEAVADRATQYLVGQSVFVGGGYTFDKLRVYKLRGVPSENLGISLVDMTDNGSWAPWVEYASAEKPLARPQFASGVLSLGYNFMATYSTFDLNRELVDNPFHGENEGTRVQGDFALAGAVLFARLGPLFPGSDIFWRGGVGGGAALMRYSGTVQVRQGIHFGEVHDVSGQADTLRPFTTLTWDLQFGKWLVTFRSLAILAGGGSEVTGFERNSLYLAYRINF